MKMKNAFATMLAWIPLALSATPIIDPSVLYFLPDGRRPGADIRYQSFFVKAGTDRILLWNTNPGWASLGLNTSLSYSSSTEKYSYDAYPGTVRTWIKVDVSGNNSTSMRTTSIAVQGQGSTQYVSIKQFGIPEFKGNLYSSAQTISELTFENTGGTKSIAISCDSDLPWYIVAPEWVSVSPTNGVGAALVSLTATVNHGNEKSSDLRVVSCPYSSLSSGYNPSIRISQAAAKYSALTYINLCGATHSNPSTYEEGQTLTFSNPSTRTGYKFTGWTPSGVTAKTTGNVTVVAGWTANKYTIAYNANGGSGTTASTSATYDQDVTLAANGFINYAKQFVGWATAPGGAVAYSARQKVRNLTATANGTITLYAIWEPLVVQSPDVSVTDGAVFCGDSYAVTLSCPLEGATIYFTTNGVTPRTSTSFAYTEPIIIYGSVDIVAVAVKDGVKSEYARVSIEQITPTAPVITPTDNTEFRSETCLVRMICETDGAEIYYTIDGSEPRKGSAIKYTAPFSITDTTTIRAVAVGGPLYSEAVTVTLTKKILPLSEAAGMIELTFTTDETAPWTPLVDDGSFTGFAAQSGTIGMSSCTWMETSVRGAGTFSFMWRVECEKDDSGGATWDRVVVFTNAVEAARIDGVTEWRNVSFVFGDEGKHTIRWEFVKDGYDEEGATFADNAWVSSVSWVSDDPIPAIEESSELRWALSFAQDKVRLSGKLTSVTAYQAFRNWVDSKGLGHTTVATSPNAWFSYALDAPGLMLKTIPLASEDVTIDAIAPSNGYLGAFDLIVDIAGAEIGTAARLAEVLDVEGATELYESAFSSEGLTVTIQRTTDGKAKAIVTPVGSPLSFFMRVKVK